MDATTMMLKRSETEYEWLVIDLDARQVLEVFPAGQLVDAYLTADHYNALAEAERRARV